MGRTYFMRWPVFAAVWVALVTTIASYAESLGAAGDGDRFEGVCTFLHSPDEDAAGGFVLQEGPTAVWVLAPEPGEESRSESTSDSKEIAWPRVHVGDRVAVEGVGEPGARAARIRPTRIHVIGSASLPPPVDATGSIFNDADNALRSQVTGIVQRARRDHGVWHLALFVEGNRLYARSARPPADGQADSLIDAAVRLTGVNGSIRNSRGQLLAPLLLINGFDDIEPIGPPPPAEFETEFVPLDEVAEFGEASLNGHRFQTEGVVSRSQPGRYLFLQSEATAVYVETADADGFRPGDRVRVAGFLDLGSKVRGIAAASVRRIDTGRPPRPLDVSPGLIAAAGDRPDSDGAAYPDLANRLVRFPATIIGRSPAREGGSLQVVSGDAIITAQLQSAAFAAAARYPSGTEISLTGIVRYDLARQPEERVEGRVSAFDKFLLLVHLPEDISLVRAAPWWTPLRLGITLGGVLAVLAAALAWVSMLQRQVQRHVRTIAAEIHERREAAVEFQATLRERTRLAANLHDTLLQTMAGIGFQIEACELAAHGDGDSDSMADHLGVARRMIDHAVDDIRGSVWALRSTAVAGMTLEEAIQAAVSRIGEGQAATIRVRTHGRPFVLPSFVTGNLMLIVQEAVFNAVHHAAPGRVDVAVAYQGGRTVEVVVHDDGAGFVPGDQPGPADGHFGIQGMRERAERLGGSLVIASEPGHGTTIRCSVPCHEYDLAIEKTAGKPALLADPPMAQAVREP